MPPCESGSSRIGEALKLATGEGAIIGIILAMKHEASDWCVVQIALGFPQKCAGMYEAARTRYLSVSRYYILLLLAGKVLKASS